MTKIYFEETADVVYDVEGNRYRLTKLKYKKHEIEAGDNNARLGQDQRTEE